MNIKKHIPNSLTLLNLLSGCIAIIFALTGNIVLVPFCVAISLFADFLDGLVARALGVSSPIGKELDSLADMVSFGVLPSVVVFVLVRFQFQPQNSLVLDELLISNLAFSSVVFFIIPFSIALFSALRLAKFNIDETQTEEFKGLATPASCIFIMGILLAFQYQHIELNFIVLCLVSCILSLLLVSNIPMFSFKLKDFKWENNKWQYIFIVLTIISLLSFKFAGISITIAIYVILNIIRYFINRQNVQS